MRDLCVLVAVAGPVLVVVARDEAETTEVAALEKVEKDPDRDAAIDSDTEVVGTIESDTDAPENIECDSDVAKVEGKMVTVDTLIATELVITVVVAEGIDALDAIENTSVPELRPLPGTKTRSNRGEAAPVGMARRRAQMANNLELRMKTIRVSRSTGCSQGNREAK